MFYICNIVRISEKKLNNKMILFFTQDIIFNFKEKLRYKRWLKQLALSYNFELYALNVIFCSNNYIVNINNTFLRHDFCTDVISFDHSTLYNNSKLSGDIYIGIEMVMKNAEKYSVSFEDELLRVMAHGLLHLMGFRDKKIVDKKVMEKQENFAILLFKQPKYLR